MPRGVTPVDGGVGSSADNALAESFNAALNREVPNDDSCWDDAATCRRQVLRWLARYNTRRRHSQCRYLIAAIREKTRPPASCPKPRNYKSRVQHPGQGPTASRRP
jgi:transposase InsO family protein